MTLHLKTAVSISFYCVHRDDRKGSLPMKSDLNQRMGAAGFLFSFRLRRWTVPQANSYANEVISRISRINLLLLATSVWSVTLAVTLQFIYQNRRPLGEDYKLWNSKRTWWSFKQDSDATNHGKRSTSQNLFCHWESKSQMLTYFEFTLNSKQEDGLACS